MQLRLYCSLGHICSEGQRLDGLKGFQTLTGVVALILPICQRAEEDHLKKDSEISNHQACQDNRKK